jgi:hypothetical protein
MGEKEGEKASKEISRIETLSQKRYGKHPKAFRELPPSDSSHYDTVRDPDR